ncbi:MAG TPA: hypothetical protein PKN04_16505, partial [bacterium]|nr:hypothetical protein [bacterium]
MPLHSKRLHKLDPRAWRRDILPNIRKSILLVWQSSPLLFVLGVALLALQSVLPLGVLYTG